MKFVAWAVAVSVFALVLLAPAVAQEDRVMATVRLTLNGDVPEGERFTLAFQETHRNPNGTGMASPGFGAFCTQECRGNGTAYIARIKVQPGSELEITVVRRGSSGMREVIFQGSRVVRAEITIDTSYSYRRGNADQQGDLPSIMPDTGAGGADRVPCAPKNVTRRAAAARERRDPPEPCRTPVKGTPHALDGHARLYSPP